MYKFLIALISISVASTAGANSADTLKNLAKGFNSVYVKAKPSVVRINTARMVQSRPQGMDPFEFFFQRPGPRQAPQQQRKQQGLGSGIIISKDGVILTNNHVIGGSDEINVELHDGRTVKAKVIGADPRTDIAVLKITASNLQPIEIADSDKVDVGDWCLALGFPFELSYTLTLGIISAKGRSNIGLADYEDFLQTDAAVNPGNSGGPLLDVEGRLIGVNTAILAPSGAYNGVSLAVPVNMAKNIMDSLLKNGRVIRGYLGIVPQGLNEDLAKHFKLKANKGVLIADVQAETPAFKAGLRAGDIITEVNGKTVTEVTQFRAQIADNPPGSTINVKVNRDGSAREFKVVLGELPTAEGEERPIRKGKNESNIEDEFGFRMQEMTQEQAFQQYRLRLPVARAVVIAEIQNGSAAENAGLEIGDIILEVDRKAALNIKDARAALRSGKSRGEILLTVMPQGFNQRRYVLLKIGQ